MFQGTPGSPWILGLSGSWEETRTIPDALGEGGPSSRRNDNPHPGPVRGRAGVSQEEQSPGSQWT